MQDKFKLYKKWFWIGIAVGFFNTFAGLVYGIALMVEPEHRKEGFIIILWSFISLAILTTILRKTGLVY
ncbi:MAG: hypothetical protein AAB454_01495 [Patescibacteria group bacterium]